MNRITQEKIGHDHTYQKEKVKIEYSELNQISHNLHKRKRERYHFKN